LISFFIKVRYASGGLLCATCPHGIVYVYKCLLKAESPCDVADMLLSMKHPPNIVISDMSHLLAAHMNKRKPNFFNPYAGRVVAPTDDNVQLAHDNKLEPQNIPWLDRRNQISVPDVKVEGTNIHPVTLVHQRLSMYDKFHERNTKQRKEILRRTKFVKQLDGVVTETAEQLNSFLSKSLYFLDCLSPVHHLIMIKFMLSIRNMNLNKKLVKNIGGANHDCDINGKILLSTKKQEGTGDDCPISSTNIHSKAGEKENQNIMLAAGDKSDNSIKELFASSSQTLDEMINPWIEDLPDCHLGFQKSGNKKGENLQLMICLVKKWVHL